MNKSYLLSSFFLLKNKNVPKFFSLTKKNSRPQAEAAVWIIRRSDINSSLA